MFKRQSLGVKEGSAIEDIVIYEWKEKRGLPITDSEREAHKAAWEVVERRKPFVERVAQKVFAPSSREKAPTFEHEEGDAPTVNYLCPTPISINGDPFFGKFVYGGSMFILGWIAFAAIASIFR